MKGGLTGLFLVFMTACGGQSGGRPTPPPAATRPDMPSVPIAKPKPSPKAPAAKSSKKAPSVDESAKVVTKPKTCDPGYTWNNQTGGCEYVRPSCNGTQIFDAKNRSCRLKTFADWCEDSEITYEQSVTLSKVLNTLKLSECGDVPAVVHNIRMLVLPASGQKISDLSPIAALTQLEVLIIPNNNIVDASPLSALHDLQVLSLRHNSVQDISFLHNLKKLKRLDLAGNPIRDLSALQELKELVRVNLDGIDTELGFSPKFQVSRAPLPQKTRQQ